LARFFHVNRSTEATGDVRTLALEEVFAPLLADEWDGATVDPAKARLVITSATFGLLALPADVPQRFAAPALVVEGSVQGAVAGDDSEIELRFGRYLPVTSQRDLAGAGFASSGPVAPGVLVRGRGKAG